MQSFTFQSAEQDPFIPLKKSFSSIAEWLGIEEGMGIFTLLSLKDLTKVGDPAHAFYCTLWN